MSLLRAARRWSSLRITLLGLAALLLPALALGEEPKKRFDIPAGDAAVALKDFSKQAGTQVVFPSADVKGVKTLALRGSYTVRGGLETLLADTGLVASFDDKSATFAVTRERHVNAPEGSSPNGPSRLADAQAAVDTGDDRNRARVEGGVVKLGAYEVLSSKLINADLPRTRDDVQPYVVFSRDTIDRSMATNLDEFFQTRLPMNQNSSLVSQGEASTVNLRGLGTNQTLILLDGRRLPGRASIGGFTGQADLNGIPLSMIERIEILPSTASGIYGGGATGGVINIITRKDYSGFEVALSYQNPFDTDASIRRATLNGSMQLEGGRTMLTVNYSRSDGTRLLMQDRDFQDRARALQLANNPAAFFASTLPPSGYTTNIRSQNGSNLVLKTGTALNSPITFVPVGYAGPATDGGAALVSNAGRYNFALSDTILGRRKSLLATPEQTSYGFSARRRFGDRVELLVDASRFENLGERDLALFTNLATLPVAAPNNPFTTPITVIFPPTDISGTSDSRSVSDRLLAGAVVRLPREWSAGLDYVWSRSVSYIRSTAGLVGDPDGSGPGVSFATALAAGTLNAIRDLNQFPLDYSAYLMPDPYSLENFALRSDEITLRGSGPVYRLPGGDVMLSASALYRDEKIPSSIRTGSSATAFNYFWHPKVSLESRAYLAELRIPIFAENASAGWRRGLEFQLAGRRDESTADALASTALITLAGPDGPFPSVSYVERSYSATKATAGFKYAPSPDVAVRASWGTGFLAPSLSQLRIGPTAVVNTALSDPKRGNQPTTVSSIRLSGGSPDLKAEDSESVSGGVILTPRFLPGLRLSIDYTRITKTDEIGNLTISQTLDYEDQLPGRIVRAPLTAQDQTLGYTGGAITQIDFRTLNIAGKRVTAWDFQADYTWKTVSWGEFQSYASATYQPDFQTKSVPAVPFVQLVGNAATLLWRGNGGLNWTKSRLSLGWNMQYYDSYRIYSQTATPAFIATSILNQGSPTIPSQVYHDVQLRYQWGAKPEGWQRYFAHTQVTVGVQNIRNTSPAITATTNESAIFAISPFGDPRGARYTMDVRRQF